MRFAKIKKALIYGHIAVKKQGRAKKGEITMKKIFSVFLALTMVLSLAACGATKDTEESTTNSSESTSVKFALGTALTKETDLKNDDGVVMLKEKYELPQLELQYEDGSVCTDDAHSEELAVCKTFNDKIAQEATEFDSTSEESLEVAKTQYADLDDESKSTWTNYSQEITIESTYQTDGLLSVLLSGYEYTGGAHPFSYTKSWNFDLTTGEFITYDNLTNNDNPLGYNLSTAIVSVISDKIYEDDLDEQYFEDFQETLDDLSTNATIYFSKDGLVATFDAYVLGAYALGAQTFTVPYENFYYALSEHNQSLLDVSSESIVISDYYATQLLWAWFNMSLPPIDSSAEEVTSDDGTVLYRVSLGNITSVAGVKELLCKHVSEELAEQWMSEGKFVDVDGALYCTYGERGSDITIGDIDYKVEFSGNSGNLTQTVHYLEFAEDTNEAKDSGKTEDFVYPFTLSDGHAIFSAFPCPF